MDFSKGGRVQFAIALSKRDSDDSEMEDATATKKRVIEEEPEDEEVEDGDPNGEYEIEAILDAKVGHFGDVRVSTSSYLDCVR